MATIAAAITTTIDGSGTVDPPPPPLETSVSVNESLSKSISEGSNIDPDLLAVNYLLESRKAAELSKNAEALAIWTAAQKGFATGGCQLAS